MKTLLLIIYFLSVSFYFYSQTVDQSLINKAAQGKINRFDVSASIGKLNAIYNDDEEIILYQADLLPVGYILLQTDFSLEPVLAYSFNSNLDEVFLHLFKLDAQERLNHLAEYKSLNFNQNFEEWNDLIDFKTKKFYEQWPPEGTTTTGGWLETNWHQGSPYNNMCPFDNVANMRSVAGCPAIAAAMILNFNKKLNGTIFTDDDDYYHGYLGNNYNIDDDYSLYKFPCFDSLNVILDTIQHMYDSESELTNYEKAGLVFACGTAARQVYNSQGSGTFGVNQAFELYEKFEFDDALLYTSLSAEMYDTLIYNMKHALPAHLAVVDEAWQYGHNVVVDGYNTDNFFHINFGWGGSNNGWWNIPDNNFPYNMNVLEGIIVNINYEEQIVDVYENQDDIFLYPNPGTGFININTPDGERINKIEVFTVEGQLIYSIAHNDGYIQISNSKNGIYLLKIYAENSVIYKKYILKNL